MHFYTHGIGYIRNQNTPTGGNMFPITVYALTSATIRQLPGLRQKEQANNLVFQINVLPGTRKETQKAEETVGVRVHSGDKVKCHSSAPAESRCCQKTTLSWNTAGLHVKENVRY